MKILKKLPDIIAIFLSCLSIAGLYLAFRWINSQLNGTTHYQTEVITAHTKLSTISAKLKLWEKLYKAKSKPKTIYKNIEDGFEIPDETMYYFKKTSDEIQFRTISDSGKQAYIHPSYAEFEYIAPNHLIYRKNYFDWEKLFISVTCYKEQQTEIKLGSSLQFNPWALIIEPFISNKRTGIEIRKQLW